MKLCIFTIVLDGEPWIEKHLPIFKKTNLDWRWIIVEGAAQNGGSTRWCNTQEERISNDGSHEYLEEIAMADDRIEFLFHNSWKSKDEMVNTAVSEIEEPYCLMEIDADEIWQPSQLEKIVQLFDERPDLSSIMFACRYFVGKDLILDGEHCYGDNDYEWLRAWRYKPVMTFKSHEPPVLLGESGYRMPKEESTKLVGKFDHFAYATEQQARYKEMYYGYSGLTDQWRRLQANENFPVSLSQFFSHVPTGKYPLVVKLNGKTT